jgi:hypothetical protein
MQTAAPGDHLICLADVASVRAGHERQDMAVSDL